MPPVFRALLAWLAFSLASFVSAQSVIINEFVSANRGGLADEDGDYEDWIELHNPSAVAVDLAGHGLSDRADAPFKWVFPEVVLPPGGYLLVRASEKNRPGAPVPGLVREVFSNIGGSAIDDLVSAPHYPEFPSERTVLDGGFETPAEAGDNYGQRLRGFLVAPVTGNYTFWISGDDACELRLSPDEDPSKAVVICSVSGYTNYRQWDKYPTQQSAAIPLVAGRRYAVVALHKEGIGGDHLSVRWRLPNGLIEAPIPVVRLLTALGELHAAFKISSTGESLHLTAPDGTPLDSAPAQALPGNVSFGRRTDDPTTWAFFAAPTPGAANSTPPATGTLPKPEFSAPAGFRTTGFALTLASPDPDATILYTLDGSEPDPARLGGGSYVYKNQYPRDSGNAFGPLLTGTTLTQTYSGPILVSDRTAQPNRLSLTNTTYDRTASNYAPTVSMFKGTVVRARLIKEGALPGPVATNTYFVTPYGENRYFLPVVSLALDDEDLIGYENGLYVAGRDFDDWRSASSAAASPPLPANYNRRGPATEKPVHFELFIPNEGRVLAQNLGVRLHGGWSRAFPMKTLRFYAHEAYDEFETVAYPLMPGRVGLGNGQPITAYRRFLLRNSGNDFTTAWNGLGATMLRDALIQEVAGPLRLDRQGYRPAVHFINGEFWGIINFRERVDRYFIASHHGADPDQVAILNNDAVVEEGLPSDRADFLALRAYAAANDLSDPVHYAHVAARMDVDNFARYSVAQIYAANTDWPQNNTDFWRVRAADPTPGAPATLDGRWRWVLFDLDLAFANSGHDTLTHALTPASDWSRVLLVRLLANTDFRNRFINTFADHLQTSFLPSRVGTLLTAMQATISPHYGEHAARWRNQGSTNADFLRNFASSRPAVLRSLLAGRFGLGATVSVNFSTPDPARGHLRVNTLALRPGEPGMPGADAAPYTWTGAYYPNVPVTVTAVPAPGHRFVGWEGRPADTSATLVVSPSAGLNLTALFEPLPVPILVHYWNFNTTTALLAPTLARPGAALVIAPGDTSETTSGTGQDFTAANARNEDPAGAHLRLNNPLGVTLSLTLPTTGLLPPVVRYETRRSGQGAGLQEVAYTLDGGQTYAPFATIAPPDGAPVVVELDFSSIAATGDNPGFGLRLTFAQGSGGLAGNNRIDNLTLEAARDPSVNHPPEIATPLAPVVIREGATLADLGLTALFADPDGDALALSAAVARPVHLAAALFEAPARLELQGLRRGETELVLTATDPAGASASHTVRVLVLPSAHRLAAGPYTFNFWDADAPELTYPEAMLFLQGSENDSTLSTQLDRAYYVPTSDLGAGDLVNQGFPYRLTSRTRMNGLGEAGVSFINTGRGRDLGGALLTLDTRDVPSVRLTWTAGTVTPNLRSYAIRLQYRLSAAAVWADVTDANGLPLEYVRSETAGHATTFTVDLPSVLLGQPTLELLWRYHFVSGTSGARAELRLDDLLVGSMPTGFAAWRAERFDAAELADAEVSGPSADPSGLGAPNLLRYALGLERSDDPSPRLPRIVLATPGPGWVFRFPYEPDLADLIYRVEASPDLVDWSEVRFDSTLSPAPRMVDGWAELDESGPTHAAPRRFLRLRVEPSP